MTRIIRIVNLARGPFLFLACLLLLPISAVAADRQIVSGPYSLSVRAGGEHNSEALGIDARLDYLTKMINLHLQGTYDWLNAGRGLGEIDNQKYGVAAALSHTYPGVANAYVGTAFSREMDENFGHAYLGGKVKVTDYALLSAAYGLGFGGVKEIRKVTSRFVGAEAVDWLKAGVILANSQGGKANVYYTLTDPGDLNISGVEGELSYPVLDFLTAGVRGNADLSSKTDVWRNWSGFAFLTYAFGDQKGNPIDVALEKNNPVAMPVVLKKSLVAAAPAPGGPLAISPTNPSAVGCSSTPGVTFTASGGTPPYTWSTNDTPTNLTVLSGGTQATWLDSADNFCTSGGPVVNVTVQDSVGAKATATINVLTAG